MNTVNSASLLPKMFSFLFDQLTQLVRKSPKEIIRNCSNNSHPSAGYLKYWKIGNSLNGYSFSILSVSKVSTEDLSSIMRKILGYIFFNAF